MTSKSVVMGLVAFALTAAAPGALALPVDGQAGSKVDLGPDVRPDLDADAATVEHLGAGLRFDGPQVLAASPVAEVDVVERDAAHAQGAPGGSGDAPLATPLPETAVAAAAATGIALALGLLAQYGGALAAGLFSRLQGQDVLQNGVRHKIHDAIAHNPGITIKELTEVCSVGWGTAVYHLRRLEGERLVVSERVRQFRRFYRNGGGIVNDAKAAFGELKSETGAKIAREILSEPGRCQKELCSKVGVSAPVAHKYIRRLREAGLVQEHRQWKSVRYFPTPHLGDLLAAAQTLNAEASTEVAAAAPVAVA